MQVGQLRDQHAANSASGQAALRPALETAARQLSEAQQRFQAATAHADQLATFHHPQQHPAAKTSAAVQQSAGVSHGMASQGDQASARHAAPSLPQLPKSAAQGQSGFSNSTASIDGSEAMAEQADRLEGHLELNIDLNCHQRTAADCQKLSCVRLGNDAKELGKPHHQQQAVFRASSRPRKKRSSHVGTDQVVAPAVGLPVNTADHAQSRYKKLKAKPNVAGGVNNLGAKLSKGPAKHAALQLQSGRRSRSAGKWVAPASSSSRSPARSPSRLAGTQTVQSKPPSKLARSPGKQAGTDATMVTASSSLIRTPHNIIAAYLTPSQSPTRHSRCLGCQAGAEAAPSNSPHRHDMSPDRTVHRPWKPSGCVHEAKPLEPAVHLATARMPSPFRVQYSNQSNISNDSKDLRTPADAAASATVPLSAAVASQSATVTSLPVIAAARRSASLPSQSAKEAVHSSITASQHHHAHVSQPARLGSEKLLQGISPSMSETPSSQHRSNPDMALTMQQLSHVPPVLACQDQTVTLQQITGCLQHGCSGPDANQQQLRPAGSVTSDRERREALNMASQRDLLEDLKSGDDPHAASSPSPSSSSSSNGSQSPLNTVTLQRSMTGLLQGPSGAQRPSMADIAHIFMQRQRACFVLQVSFL